MKYLGHLFSAKGMEPDPQKVAAVSDWDIPNNVGELASQFQLHTDASAIGLGAILEQSGKVVVNAWQSYFH